MLSYDGVVCKSVGTPHVFDSCRYEAVEVTYASVGIAVPLFADSMITCFLSDSPVFVMNI
jgi:hypothetical protein